MSGNIKVVVRVRPLNSREVARGAKCLIRMEGGTHTFIDPPDDEDTKKNSKATERKTMSFAFDHSYWSAGPKDEPGYATQQTLYEDLGVDLLDNSFAGYNSCIFAYGQTGCGKSYTMSGYGDDKGIIPLTCSALFDRIEALKDPLVNYTVEVSFMEIYNEKVRDLLNPKNKGNLRVREHPSLGPYVEDLSRLAVQTYSDMEHLMDEGNKARTVAATNMNETSSRSHSVFTLFLTQRRNDPDTNMTGEKVSRISLVDLAGSERANSTGATGQRLKEGAQINKSLTTLGKVISALAQAGNAPKGAKGKKKADEHIPYRDSVLTWLLKDSLGGNSKTAMIAAISPADYEETLSTLRYADQAKKIQNKAVVNEDPNAKVIRELKEELAILRTRMSGAGGEATYDPAIPPEKQIVQYQTSTGEIKTVTKAALQEQLEQSEKLMAEVAQTWEEKLEKTQVVAKEREQALEQLGITIEKNNVGVHTPKKMPHLVNLNEDPLMSECLIYQIKSGTTMVGNVDSPDHCDIRLSGRNILAQHCHFQSDRESGAVTLHAHESSAVMVNGKRITPESPQKLRSGYRVILGDFHIFRFNHPEEVRKHREKVRLSMGDSSNAGDAAPSPAVPCSEDASRTGSPMARPSSPSASSVIPDNPDWNFARREAVVQRLNGTDVNLDELDDLEIERLFDGVSRLRMHRRGTSQSGRESRMSFMESVDEEDDDSGGHSRPRSGSTYITDDTSLDETLTYRAISNPEVDSTLEAVRQELEQQLDMQRVEYEEKIKTLAHSASHETLQEEREQMEGKMKEIQAEMQRKLDTQKQHYEKRVKKLRHVHAGSDSESDSDDYDLEFVTFTDEQRRLAKMTIARWRSCNRVKMAETVLANAVLLKEANVISRELDKKVTYQFIVVDRPPLSMPASSLEAIKGLSGFEDAADPALAKAFKPCVGVKVLDKRNRAIYVWSLEKLQQRLKQMRNLYNFIDKPELSQHFNWEDPFYDSPCPGFSFIGNALLPLTPLYRNHSFSSTLSVFSRYSNEVIATCRVRLRPVSISAISRANGGGILVKNASGATTPVRGNASPLTDGCKLTFELFVDEVAGLSSRDFSSVHCQVRLSAFGGPTLTGEDVYASAAVEMPCEANEFRFKHSIVIPINGLTKAYLASGYAPIEFFAHVMPRYLERLERWDERRSTVRGPISAMDLASPTAEVPPAPAFEIMRQPETELIGEQFHDVSASVQMLELGASGDYVPTPIISQNIVDPGAFFLRQGLQRRFGLRLSHNSGRQMSWSKVSSVELSNVRLLDQQGRLHASAGKAVILTPSSKPSAHFEPDGTSYINFVAPWDTGAHDSSFLNRVTPPNQRVLVEATWLVDIDGCSRPARFSTDLGITVQARDARAPSKIFKLFTSSRILTKTSSLFSVRIWPVTTKKAAEIWRANTANRRVRGEEALGAWKPRGVSLVTDHAQLVARERKKADVEAIRALLAASEAANGVASPRARTDESDMFKIGRSLELWQRGLGSQRDIPLLQDPPVQAPTTLQAVSGSRRSKRKLVAEAVLVPRNATAGRRGGLYVLRDPTSNFWVKRWFVLRRPYLYIYEFSDEIEEVGVVNISNVHVDANPDMEQMLGRRNVFAVYSSANSYFFQAASEKEAAAWRVAIDPSLAVSPPP